MADESIGRRRLLRAGVALLTVLPGCGNVFIEEPTPTPDGDGGAVETTPESTPTPEPTPAASPTPEPTPTPVLPSNRLELRGSNFSLRLNKFDSVVYVDVELLVRNVGQRALERLEYRVDVRYETAELSRVVATDYLSRRFPKGLGQGSNTLLSGTTRFPRDGRAERSTDEADFSLDLTFRAAEFR